MNDNLIVLQMICLGFENSPYSHTNYKDFCYPPAPTLAQPINTAFRLFCAFFFTLCLDKSCKINQI